MKKMALMACLLSSIGCTRTAPGGGQTSFQGMWRLDRYEYRDTTSMAWLPDPGKAGYMGYIIYDGEEHMSVQLIPGNYRTLNGQVDQDALDCDSLRRLSALYARNYSYFALFDIHGDTIVHTVISASDPGLCGKVLKRCYAFTGDTLYLTPVAGDAPGNHRLKWIRSE